MPRPGKPPGAGDRLRVGVQELSARGGRLGIGAQRLEQGLGGALEDLGVLVQEQAEAPAGLAQEQRVVLGQAGAAVAGDHPDLRKARARRPPPSRRRRRCRAPGSRARFPGGCVRRDRLQAGEQELPAVGVHHAVGELHRPKSSRMRVQIVDPPAYTPPYDRSLCAALARAGADVELVTSRFAHGPVPAAEGYRVQRELLSALRRGGPADARPPGAEARRAPRRHAPLPARRRTRRRRPLPVAHGAGARQPPAARRSAAGADGPRLASRGGLARAPWPGAAPAAGSGWTRS